MTCLRLCVYNLSTQIMQTNIDDKSETDTEVIANLIGLFR